MISFSCSRLPLLSVCLSKVFIATAYISLFVLLMFSFISCWVLIISARTIDVTGRDIFSSDSLLFFGLLLLSI